MSGTSSLEGKGLFKNARRFLFWKPTLVDNSIGATVINNNNVSITTDSRLVSDSIKRLAAHSIQGAAHDSSERDPPPKCHPRTRLEFCETIQSWMNDSNHLHKVLWLHGPAGVGKSAIIQTIAEVEYDSPNSTLGATVFFSRPNKRDDPKRLFTTIAYQLAVRYPLYRQYITDILTIDPGIVTKSVSEQFKFFIIKPFVERALFQGIHKAISIMLDGMDECKGEEAQRELILLIGRFITQYPTAPLIWLIASRPEPHIHSVFSNSQVKNCHWDMGVPVDSDQACADVEHFLRDKFLEIQERYSSFFPLGGQVWPSEVDLLKITNAASGHFLFADLIVRFIVDESYGNPVAQLQTVLSIIESTSSSEIRENPFALLDNLYTQILASISPDVLTTTRMLLAWSFKFPDKYTFPYWPVICNLLDLNQAAAYGALRKLHSVILVPTPELVHDNSQLQAFHASFTDYLGSPLRSREYCTTITLEEIMRRLVPKLLESHDPANCTIEPSRITMSWVWGSDQAHIQSYLWRIIFVCTVSLIGGVSPPRKTNLELDRLASCLRDLDFGGDFFFVDHGNPGMRRFWPFARFICKRPYVFATLRDLGLAQEILLQSIDLERIRPGHAEGALLIKGNSIKLVQPSFPLGSDAVRVRCDGPNWKDRVRKHLDEIAQLQAPLLVTLIGKGCKSAVWITSPGNEWYYRLPYNE